MTFFLTAAGLMVGLVLGVVVYAFWLRHQASESLRLPKTWPLTSRVLLTNQEHEALVWLRATFPEHLVMVKVSVLRFTVPTDIEKNGGGSKWRQLLEGVYCTFTVCTTNGNVVGCVDVLGKRGMSKSSRELKESLLSDCRIAYTVVRSSALPKVAAMRAAFLGELEVEVMPEHQETRGGDSSFHADIDSFTRHKREAAKEAALRALNEGNQLKPIAQPQPAGFNPDGTGALGSGKADRRQPQFEDSFTFTDESRPAKLS